MNVNRSASDILRLEREVVTQCSISEERFRKVSGRQWENIYQKIVEKYETMKKVCKCRPSMVIMGRKALK